MTGNGLGVSRFQEFIEKDKHYWQRGQTFKPKKRQTLSIIPAQKIRILLAAARSVSFIEIPAIVQSEVPIP
ncbi:MAG TPA: hypothetical protein DEB17_00570 [Chlorobaculum sp.]|jgi:hypothetical protein|nr:hypothetical protein [Chlorobaculum sp.]